MSKRKKEEFARSLVADRLGGKDFDIPGTGYSFSAVLKEEAELMKENIKGDPTSALLPLSIADPTWKMPEEAMWAGVKYFLTDPDASRYKDNRGVIIDGKDTNDRLSEMLGLPTKMVQYSPQAIKGSLSEYFPESFFQKRDLLIFPIPGYIVVKDLINNRGVQVLDLEMVEKDGKWSIPHEDVDFPENIKRKFMYINDPHNPTGSAMNREEKVKLLAWAVENNVFLIVDEAYHETRYDDSVSFMEISGWESHCIILRSVSKGYNATGLRVGSMTSNEIIISAIRKTSNVKHSGAWGMDIIMAETCWEHPEWAIKTMERYKNLHRLLYNGLREVGFQGNMPNAGLCQFTPAPIAVNGKSFKSVIECAQWFRENLRISLMHYCVGGKWYLRWAVTIKPVPECGLETEKAVIQEVVKRLKDNKFEF